MPTRVLSRKNNRTRRNKQSGGEPPTDAKLKEAVVSVLVDEDDYERMREYNAEGIDVEKDWDDFLEFNQQCAINMSDVDKFMLMLLAKRIKANKIKHMNCFKNF